MRVHYVGLRTELPAMFFILLSLVLCLLASRRTGWLMMALFGLSTAFSIFAAMIKVQAILVLLFLPTIILANSFLCAFFKKVKEDA